MNARCLIFFCAYILSFNSYAMPFKPLQSEEITRHREEVKQKRVRVYLQHSPEMRYELVKNDIRRILLKTQDHFKRGGDSNLGQVAMIESLEQDMVLADDNMVVIGSLFVDV